MPSEWYEASGYTACEAQARGKIVIASDMGGLPENIEDGVTGFVYRTGRKGASEAPSYRIRELIRKVYGMDDDEYRKMSEAAVKRAEKDYSSEAYITKLGKLYGCLIKKKKVKNR